MKRIFIALILISNTVFGLDYRVELNPLQINNLPALHSFSFAQQDSKVLVIGGRTDGIHARQPFSSFPSTNNNINIFVVDIENRQVYSRSLEELNTALQEQLQSTNQLFTQHGDNLYIAGGYAFSPTANDHITFPNLTSIKISKVIDAIINQESISEYFKQITNDYFAITGGHLTVLNDEFYMIGGHRFDGRYNPMGHATYTQQYTNKVKKFSITDNNDEFSFSIISELMDEVHLRRRDYNLVSQVFSDGSLGYMISSGVFQPNADLPFLYPVNIYVDSFQPVTEFSQYLSNYHSAAVGLYDAVANEMHSLFLGGMSQYYYKDDVLVQDDQVPFVKTISRVTRYQDGTMKEFRYENEMNTFEGASSEFIFNPTLPLYPNEVIKINEVSGDTILLGYVYGGIISDRENPFSNNMIQVTKASNKLYEVKMIKDNTTAVSEIIDSKRPDINIYYNRNSSRINIEASNQVDSELDYYISTIDGKIIKSGVLESSNQGLKYYYIDIENSLAKQVLNITVIFNKRYFTSEIIIVE